LSAVVPLYGSPVAASKRRNQTREGVDMKECCCSDL
jgi:hypothetical protein